MPRKGEKLLELLPGELIGRKRANILIRFYNAFMQSKLVRGSSDDVLISDNNIVLKIKDIASSGNGDVNYRGEYAPDGSTEFNPGPFVFGDIVRVTSSNSNSTTLGGTIDPGVYICIQDGPSTGDLPSSSDTAFWQLVSKFSVASGSIQQFRFKSYHANYLTCRTWNGTTEGGSDVYVSVPFKMLEVSSETIDGDSYSYSYSNDSNGNRIRTVTKASDIDFYEEQMIVPRLLTNDLILATPIPTGYTSQSGPTPTYVDLNLDGRAWSGMTGATTLFPNL